NLVELWKLKEIRCYESDQIFDLNERSPYIRGNFIALLYGDRPTIEIRRILMNILSFIILIIKKIEKKYLNKIFVYNLYCLLFENKIKKKNEIKKFTKNLLKLSKLSIETIQYESLWKIYKKLIFDQLNLIEKNVTVFTDLINYNNDYLFSSKNSIMDYSKIDIMYQDDNQPINNYFIYSSHNT
ncbi:hypothetical protein HZS_4214, partial [Henneguya salminicola]